MYNRILGLAIRRAFYFMEKSKDPDKLRTDLIATLTIETIRDGEMVADEEILADAVKFVNHHKDVSNFPSHFKTDLQMILTNTKKPSEIAELTRGIHVLCDYIESSKFYYPNLYFVDELTQSQRLAQMEEWHSEILDLRKELGILLIGIYF